jgi:HK97 family phage portal protein
MLFEKRNVSLSNPPQWLIDSIGASTYSGETVTVDRALTVPGVLAAVTILSQDIASLPLILYRRLPRGKERATDNPHYPLLHDMPNPEMTSYQFREIQMGHLLGWGNAYAQKIWDRRGIVRELWLLDPSRMEVGRKDGARIYLYRDKQGRPIAFTDEEIWHVHSLGFDGVKGLSLINLARNAIGLAMATEKYGSRVMQNDARPSVVIKHPQNLKPPASTNLIESWNQAYSGAGNAGKAVVLEEGMDISTIGFPSKDAQYIETQQWTVQQFARVFRIPPHMLGDITNSTSWGTGIEQQELGYLTHTLRPWMVRIEQSANKDILLDNERGTHFYEHLVDAMLRTDVKTRMDSYAVAITNGVMTRNEARERENLLPYEYGDEALYPANMVVAGQQNQPTAPQRDITPLLQDAARRIAKRDENELSGALKRYEGKPEKWDAWLEEFYKRDYPAFIIATLQPLLDAGLMQPAAVARFVNGFATWRGVNAVDAHDNGTDERPELEKIISQLQEACHA